MNTKLVGALAAVALLSLPLAFGLIPPNWFYGFRTARTLSDRVLWFRINRFAGWAFVIASGVGAALILVFPHPDFAVLEFAGPIAMALFVSIAYLKKTSA